MSGQFKVGEILVGQNFIYSTEKNGMECTVLEGLEFRAGIDMNTFEMVFNACYVVEWADGEQSSQEQKYLRRKRPPAGEQSVFDQFKLPELELA